MAMQLGHFTVISLAEIVATLDSVLPVCQDGHNAQYLKSITILDGVSVAPVSDNIEVPGGVSCCPLLEKTKSSKPTAPH